MRAKGGGVSGAKNWLTDRRANGGGLWLGVPVSLNVVSYKITAVPVLLLLFLLLLAVENRDAERGQP